MLNTKMRLALDLVSFLRADPQKLENFCKLTGYPMPFSQQIGRKLRMNGVINVKRGPNGGYYLNAPVSYYQVYKSLNKMDETNKYTNKLKEVLEATFV